MMNIVIDENISYAEEAFSQFGKVSVFHGRKINNHILENADALIVRSITKVDKNLLQGTPVKFVGTATIGTDHIDLDYLRSNGICFSDAKGCNADAVTEYVFSSIIKLLSEQNLPIKERSIGIVGIGNIGSRIAKIAEVLGMKVFKNDPPLQRQNGAKDFVPLDNIYKCDIITLHVPFIKTGTDRTVHLFNQANLAELDDNIIFINASRGQVVDNTALIETIDRKSLNVVLDVWENEPGINTELLEKVKIGSPHIAGYSLEGKVNGTVIIYKAFCNYLGIQPIWKPSLPKVNNPDIVANTTGSYEQILNNIIHAAYSIEEDDDRMKKLINMPEGEISNSFDTLRKEYPLRREFTNYNVMTNKNNEELTGALKALRFGNKS
jgi:erythronate-4-phosphate dehydrogenase